jgi:hypothetical protein
MIEDALREAFADRVAEGPEPPRGGERAQALADGVIRRAGHIRRRRMVGSSLAGVLVVAFVGITALQYTMRPQPGDAIAGSVVTEPDWPVPSTPAPARGQHPAPTTQGSAAGEVTISDLTGPGEVFSETKVQVTVDKGSSKSGSVSRAFKAEDAYLVIKAKPDKDQQLLLRDLNGNFRTLVDSAQKIVISKQGDKVSWVDDNKLSVAAREPNAAALEDTQSTNVQAGVVPMAILGAYVVLSRHVAGDTPDAYNLWSPGHAILDTTWNQSVVRVFDPKLDGTAIYAQVRDVNDDTKVCFAVLTPDKPFKTNTPVCGLPRPGPTQGGVSPDGHWLAYPVDGGKTPQVAMVDLTTLFTGSPKPDVFTLQAASARSAWVSPDLYMVDSGGKFVGLRPGQPNKQDSAQGSSTDLVPVEPLSD